MKLTDVLVFNPDLMERLIAYDDNTDYYISETINQFNIDVCGEIMPASNTYFYHYLEWFEGLILERIFAIRHCRGKEQCKEVCRRIETNKFCLIKDSYFCNDTFWRYDKHLKVLWNEKKYCYDVWQKWKEVPLKLSFNAFYRGIEKEDVLKFDDKLKYSGLELFNGDFMEYISAYRIHPELEWFSKMGIISSMLNKNFLNRIKKHDKQFMKYCFKNKDALYYRNFNYDTILFGFKNNLSVIEASHFDRCKTKFKSMKLDIKKIITYCKKINISISEYYDHCVLLTELFDDWNKKDLLFPKNFHEKHSEYISLKQVISSEKESKKYLKIRDKALERCFEDDDYILFVPGCYDEFVDEAKQQCNCLVRCDYYNKMLKGNCYIYFLRKKENLFKSFITIEYNPKTNQMIQCYLKNNSSPNPNLKEYIRKRLCS